MNTISWLVAIVLLSLSPQVRYARDRRNFDGYRYTEYCAGLYQRPETWACIEVAR